MKVYFFDTSALVKRYHVEKGTDKVDSIFNETHSVIAISNIAIVEFVSALSKKKEQGAIDSEDIDRAVSRFFSDVIKDFLVLDLNDGHVKEAISLVMSKGLRTLDSLQLAIAMELKDADLTFVSSDKKLVSVANDIGLKTITPE